MKIKMTIAVDLMLKCIKSCELPEQLEMTMEWMEATITEERFPEVSMVIIHAARSVLYKEILIQKDKIFGIGDIDELNLKTQTIHE